MLTLNNLTNNALGPYNGVTIPANQSITISGAVAPYISDGTLLSDLLAGNASVNYSDQNSIQGAPAAALLMQLGQVLNTDSDGASLSRVKQAPVGWTYQLRGFDVTTASVGSLVNNDFNNNPLADVTQTFYDANGNQVTDPANNGTVVKTVLDFMPAYDYYIIGGYLRVHTIPSNDVRVSVVAVPDYPAVAGGSKCMVQNINLKYLQLGDKVEANGRASKGLLYNNPVPNTNKIRFVFYHEPGDQNTVEVAMELFKV